MAGSFYNLVYSIHKFNPTFKISQLPQALKFKSTFFLQKSPANNLHIQVFSLQQMKAKDKVCVCVCVCILTLFHSRFKSLIHTQESLLVL